MQGAVNSFSRGTLHIEVSNFYPLLARMCAENLIKQVEPENDPNQRLASSRPRTTYAITEHGLLVLKADLQRIQHALDVANRAGLLNDDIPLEIQQLLQQLA